ncbi:DNA mismatch repair protein MutT [Sphingomonas sp. Leaf412]|uniref:NUDIX hydrolase n=1 Tax=Sphingomonas sp. Leaf412 TaxID=1736370 RepID=UPI0006FC3F78|nr:NUDIX domain-containing protein [Sphingomonas sp. Leaf412]KQT34853.1 DNA mismatch repair protein MutT [Sphingomonas sp. Leaf412]
MTAAGGNGQAARTPRPAARILLVDAAGRVLLFRFTPDDRPPLWCTPGGAVDPGESYEAAARRELWEETGLDVDCGPQVARRVVDFLTFERVEVTADERWFRVDVAAHDVVAGALTEQERRIMAGARWFDRAELADWPETIYPADLPDMLAETDRCNATT